MHPIVAAWAALLLLGLNTGTAAAMLLRRIQLDRGMLVLLAAQPATAALTWLVANGPLEGPTLVVLAPGHGVTLADLLVLLPVAASLAVLRRLSTVNRERA